MYGTNVEENNNKNSASFPLSLFANCCWSVVVQFIRVRV